MIVDQTKENHRVRKDGGSVDVDLIATLHEGGEVHLEGPSDVIKSDPLMWNQPGRIDRSRCGRDLQFMMVDFGVNL
jgi:hypothetical protein